MPTPRYLEVLIQRIRALGKDNAYISEEQLHEAERLARAQVAGEASGAARRTPADPETPAPETPTAEPVAASVTLANARMMAACPYCSGTNPAATPSDCNCTADCGAENCQGAVVSATAGQSPAGGIRLSESELAPVYSPLRLDDGAGGLPNWQVYHQVGNHGVHPTWGLIDFTYLAGDQIIRNHEANTLGRAVPLDFRHGTQLDGEAGGYVERFRWGRPGEGLPGQPEPSGEAGNHTGPILYARFPEYNDVGRQKLANEHYRHQSPEYDRNYQGKYGAVALALAATNNPFLKHLRTLQGREQLPVLLDDGSIDPGQEPTMPPEATPPTTPPTDPAATPAATPAGAPALTAGAPAGSVSLEEFNQMRAQLQLANAQLSSTQVLAEEIRRDRHTDAVAARTSRAIERGTPPALVRVIGAVMLAHRPEEPGVVRLDNDPAAAPVNDFAAMDALLELLPRVHMGRVTLATTEDDRPADGAPDEKATAESQKATAAEINRGRQTVPAVPGSNGTH